MKKILKAALLLILAACWFPVAASIYTLPSGAIHSSLGDMAHLYGVDGALANPAATSTVEEEPVWQADANFRQLTADLRLIGGNVLMPKLLPVGNLAAGFSYFSTGGFANIDALGVEQGVVSAYDLLAYLNYSRPLAQGLIVGGSAKIVHRTLHEFSSNTIAFDLGMRRRFMVGQSPLWLALAVQNLGAGERFEDTSVPLPWRGVTSASFSLRRMLPRRFSGFIGPQLAYEYERGLTGGAGLELSYTLRRVDIWLRSRILGGQAPAAWSLGTGISYKRSDFHTELSVGALPHGQLGNSLVLGLKFSRPYSKTIEKKERAYLVDHHQQLYGVEMARELQYMLAGPDSIQIEERMRQAQQRYGITFESPQDEFIILNEKKVVLWKGGQAAELPHELQTAEGSILRGLVTSADERFIEIETARGKLKVYRKSVVNVVDKRVDSRSR